MKSIHGFQNVLHGFQHALHLIHFNFISSKSVKSQLVLRKEV